MDLIHRMTTRTCLSLGRRRKSPSSKTGKADLKTESRQMAPHPIPPGSEGRPCPIAGLFASADIVQVTAASGAHFEDLQADPDIAEEIRSLAAPSVQRETRVQARRQVQLVSLGTESSGAHKPDASTRQLMQEVGLPALMRFTEAFYQKSFVDVHVDKLIASHDEPHHKRFAMWIAERLGDGTPWTEERRTRPAKYMEIGGVTRQVAHDRSSAHTAAWNSPKREPHKRGQHFQPDDARVWMRLHFWAARETGMFEHKVFMEYYIRFIGHFISVYSSKAVPFTRDSVRWSADPMNVQRYLDAGRVMTDVIGQDYDEALAALPQGERRATGRKARDAWPYGVATPSGLV